MSDVPFSLKFRSWRVRTPLLIQMQDIECGATALGIILGFYGKAVSLGDLRLRCSVTRDGCNGLDIVKAAHFYGLEAHGYALNTEALEQLRSPAILYWDSNHFVVLEGFSKKEVFVNDPAFGPLSFSRQDFERHYTGIALVIKPGDTFEKSSQVPGIWQKIKEEGKKSPGVLLFYFLSGLFLLLPSLTVPIVVRLFIDHGYRSNAVEWKVEALFFFLFALVFGLLFQTFYLGVVKSIGRKISTRFSSEFLWQLLRLPLSFFQQRDAREIAGRIQLSRKVSQEITGELFPAGMQLLFSFFYAILLFAYDLFAASVTLLGALACLITMHIIYRLRLANTFILEKEEQKSDTCSLDILSSIEMIKSIGAEGHFFHKWKALYTNYLNRDQQIEKKGTLLNVFPFFMQLFCSALLLAAGSREIMKGNLTLGMLAAMQIFLLFFLYPLRTFIQLSDKVVHLSRHLGSIEDVIYASLDRTFQLPSSSQEPFQWGSKGIEFKNVTFKYYPSSSPVLDNLSFSVKPGELLGITGPVGAGKSTLSKLAVALLHPSEGVILYEGKGFQELKRETFCKQIGWVSQENFIFSGSYEENLTLWNSQISEEKIVEVAKVTAMHEWMKSHPFQYQEPVLEWGMNLSYREKQQLEVTRELVKEPRFIVIDEGMNALDVELQKNILHFLKQKQCTCFFVTHQKALLEVCDQILVLDEGKLVQKGSHRELMAQEGLYRTLFVEQRKEK